MHQGKLDFDLDLSVNDITTLVQDVTLDLTGATRKGDATRRLLDFTSIEEVLREVEEMPRTRIGQEQVRVLHRQLKQSAVPTSYSRILRWSKIEVSVSYRIFF